MSFNLPLYWFWIARPAQIKQITKPLTRNKHLSLLYFWPCKSIKIKLDFETFFLIIKHPHPIYELIFKRLANNPCSKIFSNVCTDKMTTIISLNTLLLAQSLQRHLKSFVWIMLVIISQLCQLNLLPMLSLSPGIVYILGQ